MGIRIGIDSGGTFTDLIAIDDETRRIYANKVPSTPSEPLTALKNIVGTASIPTDEVTRLILGTTVATNALIQRAGARVLFICTRGIEDVLELQTANRPDNYRLLWRRPTPLVRRRWCIGVQERIDHSGAVVVPLTDESLEQLASTMEEIIRRDGIQAIAICLLFSYINPAHEQRLAAFIAERFPSLPVSMSHRVAPIWREYERSNTTVADAFVKPLITEYVRGARRAFQSLDLSGAHCLMKSNGGMALLDTVPDRPLDTLLSGLVAGAIAGQFYGNLTGNKDVITFDMGGTSCDVALIVDGNAKFSTRFDVEWGLPISNPTVDVRTVGAGGGSIGWVDRGGFLRVGPQSAGAEPGPAAYGAGGTDPTVTDANLVLNRLNPDYFLGGKMKLSVNLAREAIGPLADKARMSERQAALAIIRVVNDNMAGTIRLLTVEKGIDPRGFALVAFGGAGPLHACGVARELQIPRIVVPIYPGQCSAFGTLIADVRIDRVWTYGFRSDNLDIQSVGRAFDMMVRDATDELRRSGFEGNPVVKRYVSMRYRDQNYEEDILLCDGPITPETLDQAYREFHRRHEGFYGYSFPEETFELVHFKVTALGPVPAVALPHWPAAGEARPVAHRPVNLSDSDGPADCPVYHRADLRAGARIPGPAIIEEESSTTLVEADYDLTVDGYGNLILTQREPA